MANMRTIDCDIAIVGAGVVGLTFALEMASALSSINIVIINKGDFSSELEEGKFSPRVSAISQSSDKIFRRLGVWDHVSRKQPYRSMHVWDKDSFGEIEFSATEINSEYLGHIIENNVLEAALRHQISNADNIEVLDRTALKSLNQNSESVHLFLEQDIQINSRLVIGADGANSAIKSFLKLPETFWDYDHTAIVSTVKTEKRHGGVARQVFTPYGPLAFLPLPDEHQVSIVWSQESAKAKSLLELDDEDFCNALFVEIDGECGRCQLLDNRYAFPLRMRYTRQWVKDCVVLAGDAAHTIHPLAGQGANLGIADVNALAKILIPAIGNGELLNSRKRLREYERWRKAEALKTIATMELFKRGFDGDNSVKKLVRNIALNTADKVRPIKDFFIRQASGF